MRQADFKKAWFLVISSVLFLLSNAFTQKILDPQALSARFVSSFDHSLAVTPAGKVVFWGKEGQNNVLAGLTDVIQVAAHGIYSMALLKNGTVIGLFAKPK